MRLKVTDTSGGLLDFTREKHDLYQQNKFICTHIWLYSQKTILSY